MSRAFLLLSLLVLGLVVVSRATAPEPVVQASAPPADTARPRPAEPAAPAPGPVQVAAVTGPVASSTPTIDRLVRIETRRRIAQSAGYGYIDSLLATTDSTIRRWGDREGRPILVAIVGADSGAPARLKPRIWAAARLWESLELGVRFAETADTSQAQIIVGWIDHFEQARTGQTDTQSGGDGVLVSARITLAIRDSANRVLGDPEVGMVAVHEFGHALGMPHSARRTDVMFPVTSVGALSDRDRATAVLLYSVPPGPLREPSS